MHTIQKINEVILMKQQHIIDNKLIRRILYGITYTLFFILLAGCNKVPKESPDLVLSPLAKGSEVVEKYDTQALGVVKAIGLGSGTITYLDVDYGTDVTLVYNGGTEIVDKYGKVLSISQIKVGEMVDLYFSSEKNKLVKLQISNEAWEYQGVSNLVIVKTNKMMKIVKQKYKYTKELVVVSDDNLIDLMDINKKDELTVKGRDGVIYSIIINKGHGYIKLINYEDFIDGMIEVGYDIILPVVKDMLIIAREGNYKMILEKDSLIGSKNINVIRDKEIIVDMADFALEPIQVSNVEFTITPYGADLYLDNKLIDYDEVVELKFGEHKIEVKLGGYTTYSGILTADMVNMDININLVEKSVSKVEPESDSEEDSNNTVSNQTNNGELNNKDIHINNGNDNNEYSEEDPDAMNENNQEGKDNVTIEVDLDHKILVMNPEGAQVYLNGILKGVAPVSFEKEIGTHTISFRKDGYITKSYTVEVLDDSNDIQLSFPKMIKK